MSRVYTPSTQHLLRSPPMPPSGPTHCHSHRCAYCVRYHKVRLSTVQSKAVCATQQVFRSDRSTVQTSMNTPGAQTCHTTASHLIEHTHTHIGPSSTSTGSGGSAPPHTLSGSANGEAHVTLLTVPGTMTFTLHLVNTVRGT